MKKYLLITALALFSSLVQAQTPRLKIGSNPTSINSSAALEIESTTRGLLPSRMTKAQMDAIASPAEGLLLYCTDCTTKGLHVYDGAAWNQVSSGTATVVADCDTGGFATGTYIAGVSGTRTFTVTITNNSFYTTTIAFQNSDLVLSGVTGLSVTATSPTTTTLNAGQTQLVTYTITGTPAAQGTLTAVWTKLGLTCTRTRNVSLGDAVFTLPVNTSVASASGFQGIVSNTSPNQLIINVPYTGGQGSYAAFTGTAVTGTAGEGGDINKFIISYPAGTFAATGTIPVTIIVDGDETYNVKQLEVGISETFATLPFVFNGETRGSLLLRGVGGIPDRAFGQTINGANNHNFVYGTVTAPNGRTWLNHNLGAHYTNVNHASFNPSQKATATNDHLAYGSLLQFGRRADGHELITWTGGTVGTAVNSTTSITSATDTPPNNLFITSTGDWRTTQNNNLWQGVDGINNPCPVGYRVPTSAEYDALFAAAPAITNAATALSSVMGFTLAGYRTYGGGSLSDSGTAGFYRTSTVSGNAVTQRTFNSSSTSNGNWFRGDGLSMRCIKD